MFRFKFSNASGLSMYLCAFAICLLVTSSRPPQATQTDAKPGAPSNRQNPQIPKPEPPSPASESDSHNTRSSAHYQGYANQQTMAWYDHNWIQSSIAFLGLILNVVGLFVIYRQVKSSEEAADAAKISADAATAAVTTAIANTKAMTSAERSWLLVSDRSRLMDVWKVDLWATNLGRSPAEVLSVFWTEQVLNLGEELPNRAQYEPDEMIFAHRQWVAPKRKLHVNSFYTDLHANGVYGEQIRNDLKSSRKRLWIYGRIRYRDSISTELHETRFCYWISPIVGLLMGGPNGYNDHT